MCGSNLFPLHPLCLEYPFLLHDVAASFFYLRMLRKAPEHVFSLLSSQQWSRVQPCVHLTDGYTITWWFIAVSLPLGSGLCSIRMSLVLGQSMCSVYTVAWKDSLEDAVCLTSFLTAQLRWPLCHRAISLTRGREAGMRLKADLSHCWKPVFLFIVF